MDVNSQVQVVLFKHDGTSEVFTEAYANHGYAPPEIDETEPPERPSGS